MVEQITGLSFTDGLFNFATSSSYVTSETATEAATITMATTSGTIKEMDDVKISSGTDVTSTDYVTVAMETNIPGQLYFLDGVIIAAFAMLTLVTVSGNALTIAATRVLPWLRTPSGAAVEGLAWADALLGVSGMLRVTDVILIPRYYGVVPAAIITLTCINRVLLLSALLHPILLLGERFLSVLFPFFHAAHVTSARVRFADVTMWGISVLLSLDHIYFLLSVHLNLEFRLSPKQLEQITQVVNIALYLMLLVLFLVLQGRVLLIVRKHQIQIEAMQLGVHGNQQGVHGNRVGRGTVTTLAVTLCSILLWFPSIVVECAALYRGGHSDVMALAALIGLLFGHINSAINVLIYCVMNRKYRLAYKTLLGGKLSQEEKEFVTKS